MIKHNATEKAINIRDHHDGLDFEFKNRSHGIRLVDFIQNKFVSSVSHSKQLVSHDE
jgi:nonsense-mediated mRNA decay protein 3